MFLMLPYLKYHPTRTRDLERVIPVPRQDMDSFQFTFDRRPFFEVMSAGTFFFDINDCILMA